MTARVVSSERGATPPRRRPGARTASSSGKPSPKRAAAPERTAARKRAAAPKQRPPSKRGTRHPARPRRRRTALWLVLGSVVLVGLLFAFVYPTRTFLDQRSDLGRARDQLSVLSTENAKLAGEAKRLQDPDEIVRRARDYGLVRPGEQPYVIVPTPTTPPTTAPPGGTATPSP
jgi:cell division protein FtsB